METTEQRKLDLEDKRITLERERFEAERDFKNKELEVRNKQFEYELNLKAENLKTENERTNSFKARLERSFASAIPFLIALATATFGLIQFGLSQRFAAEAAIRPQIEGAKKQFDSLRNFTLYEGARTAYFLATQAGNPKSKIFIAQKDTVSARDYFEELYWIKMPLYENEGVAYSMVEFRDTLLLRDNIDKMISQRYKEIVGKGNFENKPDSVKEAWEKFDRDTIQTNYAKLRESLRRLAFDILQAVKESNTTVKKDTNLWEEFVEWVTLPYSRITLLVLVGTVLILARKILKK